MVSVQIFFCLACILQRGDRKNFRTFQLWLITLAPLPWNGILRIWRFELCQWRRRWSRWYYRWACYLDLLSKHFVGTRHVNGSSLTFKWLGWYLNIGEWFMKNAVFEQKKIKLWYEWCFIENKMRLCSMSYSCSKFPCCLNTWNKLLGVICKVCSCMWMWVT